MSTTFSRSRTFLIIALLLFLSASLSACAGDSDSFTGRWKSDDGSQLQLNDDNTGLWGVKDDMANIAYTLQDNNVLRIEASGIYLYFKYQLLNNGKVLALDAVGDGYKLLNSNGGVRHCYARVSNWNKNVQQSALSSCSQ